MRRQSMHRHVSRLIVLALLVGGTLLVGATAAHAEAYIVTLTNGTVFETRYEPEPAEWDENVLLINTDRGNWIGLLKEEVADVTSVVETTGFGYQLNTTTLFVGWSPNDIDAVDENGEPIKLDEIYPEEAPSFTLEQFVDIPSSGAGIGSQPITVD